MPELPEVETVRRGLQTYVVGRTVASAQVLHPRAVRRHVAGAADLEGRLAGRRIEAVRRRGKYLWLALDDGDAVIAHLGMSGQLVLVDAAEPAEPHLRVRVTFADGGPELRFVDQRTFGGLSLSAGGAELPTEIAHIARDPLDPEFDDAVFSRALRRRRQGLKRALLDQTLVSGIGAIYADESLWGAQLHWARRTETLRPPEVRRLLGEVRSVLEAAVAAGGTSFDALYVDVNGSSGWFDVSLHAYGQEGRPCDRCGTPIRRARWANRSVYWCPTCQPTPRLGRP